MLGGRVENGVLYGDLYLVGGGDPYMTDERWWSFVQGLRERGLAKITGDVVIDNNYFAPITDSRGDFRRAAVPQLQRAAGRADGELPELALHREPVRPALAAADRRQPAAGEPRIEEPGAARRRPLQCGSTAASVFDMPDRTRSEHAGRARRVSGFMRHLLGDARDHDRAGLCIWNVSHDVDAGGWSDRRRGAHGAPAIQTRACCSSTTRCRSPRSSAWSTSSRTT